MSSQRIIKETALQLFTDRGYEGTSLADIAEIVGLKKSSIYNHYKSKDDLFIYIYEYSVQTNLSKLRTLFLEVEGSDFQHTLDAAFSHMIEVFSTNVAANFLFRFMSYPPHHLTEQSNTIKQQYLTAFSRILKDSLILMETTHTEEQLEKAVYFLRVIINGLYADYMYKRTEPTPEVKAFFKQVLLDAVKPFLKENN